MTSVTKTDGLSASETRALLDETRRFIARKHARQQARNRDLWHNADQDAKRITRMIVRDFAPRAIYQWGCQHGKQIYAAPKA